MSHLLMETLKSFTTLTSWYLLAPHWPSLVLRALVNHPWSTCSRACLMSVRVRYSSTALTSGIYLSLLRRQIGYVPQETFLFSVPLEENISYGVEAMSKERIQQ